MPDTECQFDSGEKTGAYFAYSTTENQKIKMRVGISYISCGKAKENLKEITSWDFDKIHSEVVAKWNTILGKVEITGNKEDKIKF